MSQKTEWVAVDWGTSNLRAWGISADGLVTFAHASDQGMGKIGPDDYPGILARLLAKEIATASGKLDVLICGMAGARQGWREAPYLDAPADLGGLVFGAVDPGTAGSQLAVRILPGVCQRGMGAEDVMRGEETQLLGLSALLPGFSGVAVMPGTHSKWAELDQTHLTRFQTVMTGELFDLLKTHSVLRHSLNGPLDLPDRDAGFDAGAAEGLDSPHKVTATLFKVRAGSLLSGRSPAWCAGFLSGLLVGAEIGGQRDWITDAEIPLVGGVAFCELYRKAFSHLGAKTRIIDATDATLAGLKLARNAS